MCWLQVRRRLTEVRMYEKEAAVLGLTLMEGRSAVHEVAFQARYMSRTLVGRLVRVKPMPHY
jgi:hypothetical protein